MDNTLIIYPGFAIVCLTFLLYTKNRIEVGRAFSNKEIKGSYLKLFKRYKTQSIYFFGLFSFSSFKSID